MSELSDIFKIANAFGFDTGFAAGEAKERERVLALVRNRRLSIDAGAFDDLIRAIENGEKP